jgi:hypothetical protein
LLSQVYALVPEEERVRTVDFLSEKVLENWGAPGGPLTNYR